MKVFFVASALVLAASHVSAQTVRMDDMVINLVPSHLSGPASANGLREYHATKWPNGILPIEFHTSLSADDRSMFMDSCALWGQYALVECVPWDGVVETRVYVTTEFAGCWSYVGYPINSAGRQTLNLGYNCKTPVVMIHEIGHALGLAHEHQRSDRDAYIRINYSNVQPGQEINFAKFANVGEGPYDFMSVMHYGPWAFAKGFDRTINAQPNHAQYEGRIGSSQEPTVLDGAGLARMYGATARTTIRVQANNTNPVMVYWQSDVPLTSQTVLVGTQPGLSDVLVMSLPGYVRSLEGIAPLNTPLYVRIVGDQHVSNDASIYVPFELKADLTGNNLFIHWPFYRVQQPITLTVTTPKGSVLTTMSLVGTHAHFTGVPAGDYRLQIHTSSLRSNVVSLHVQ